MEAQQFGIRLRELRIQAHLTQRELAEKIGVDFSYLSKIENGALPPPSEKLILKLAEVLNADKDELIISAGRIPADIAEMLKNRKTLELLRSERTQKKVLAKKEEGNHLIKDLKNLPKVTRPRIPIINYKNFARVAVAIILVIAVGASLWFASPLPVRALEISISPPASGTLGSTHTFTVNVTVQNMDVLPVWRIDLEIYKVSDPTNYKATLESLPLDTSSRQTHSVTAGSAEVAASVAATWGYGTAYSYGYGYREPQGWGYHYFGTRGGYGYGQSPYKGTTSIKYTVYWTSPSGSDWAGTYKIKALVYGSADKKFSETSDSFSLTRAAAPADGAVGGRAPGITSVLYAVTQEGRFTENVTVRSADRKVELYIAKGTIGLNRVGQLIFTIRIREMEEPPDAPVYFKIIPPVYQIGPDGATFDPPIDLTISYDASLIPQGVAEKNLVVATYDSSAHQWEKLESIVNPDTDTIKAKVSHFSAFAVLAPTRPASFTVTDLSITPSEVYVGERVSISVLITNSGDLTGSHEISLKINNKVTQTSEVILDGGDSETISFSVTPDTVGEYSVDVSGLSGTFAVKELKAPAAFTTSSLTISPSEVYLGERVTISVTVTNTGDLTGAHKVTLKIDGVVEDEKEVVLDRGASQKVVFTIIKHTAGTYAVEVDRLLGSFVISEKAPPVVEEEIPPAPPAPAPVVPEAPPTPPINWWLIGGIIAAVIVISLIAWLVVVQRRG